MVNGEKYCEALKNKKEERDMSFFVNIELVIAQNCHCSLTTIN